MQLASIAPAALPTSHVAVKATAPVASLVKHQIAAEPDLDAYYAPAQGKTGADLLHSLATIVRDGHIDRGYASARDELFGTLFDLDGDDKVEDVFTGYSKGPITGRKDAYSAGMNTEHTWAQSKGATGIAQCDLHHLQPADIHTNEMRGSFPYGDVVKSTWSTGSGVTQAKLGVDELGATVFEPQAAKKGDIARGLLYFFTRYNESRPGSFTTADFKHELPTLLKWNAADPVDDNERAMNAEIYKFQGNLNPFVDHPEFIDAIDFPSLTIN